MIIYGFSINILKGKKMFLVCGKSFDKLPFADSVLEIPHFRFSDFTSNPKFEDIMNGVKLFEMSDCDTLFAVGGGSAIDVAKCIKYFSKKNIKIIAMPTTSGSGSEATNFAVIYKNGVKQSVKSSSLLPEYAILDETVLKSVPLYTRKSTMLDALCHAIESYWSKRATEYSRLISEKAIEMILSNKKSYLNNEDSGNLNMLKASNLAGQAINITTTTAAHAMSYMITSLYGLAHGHAVSLCLPEVWKANNVAVPGITPEEFNSILEEFNMKKPCRMSNNDIGVLADSVNIERLENNPIVLSKAEITEMYERIVI